MMCMLRRLQPITTCKMRRAARSCVALVKQLSCEAAAPADALYQQQGPGVFHAINCQHPWSQCGNSQHNYRLVQDFGSVRHASSWLSRLVGRGSDQKAATPLPDNQQHSTPIVDTGPPQQTTEIPTEHEVWPLPEDASEPFHAIIQAITASEKAVLAAASADLAFYQQPVAWVMLGLESLHNQGIPWWAAIAIVNLASKVLTVPLTVLSRKWNVKMVETQHGMAHIKLLQQQAQNAASPTDRQRLLKSAQKAYNDYVAANGNPTTQVFKPMGVMIVNGIIFLSIFAGVRKLMESGALTLKSGGMLWFTDLTMPDPYYGLPVLCSLLTFGMIYKNLGLDQSGATENTSVGGFDKQWLKYMGYGVAGLIIPASAFFPSAVSVLYFTNSCWAIIQNIALKNDKVRIKLGMPTLAEMRKQQQFAEAVQQQDAVSQTAQERERTTAPSAAVIMYDAEQAAADLVKRMQRDASGKPILFASNPNAAALSAGMLKPRRPRNK